MEDTTSHCICGFWFHITWDRDEGVDQQGNVWHNKENPTPEDKTLVDRHLDAFNEINKKLGLK